jgi:hypothetical protein
VNIMARIRGPRGSRPDEGLESWIAWRAACDSVESAYSRWVAASVAERPLAFAGYRVALAREEEHAESYAVVASGGNLLRGVAS